MKKLIWEFLNKKYGGMVIYHQKFNLHDRTSEKFFTDSDESIMEYSYYHNGGDVWSRVNSFLKGDIGNYFDIHDIDIEMYVLEWCRDKSVDAIDR